MNPEIAPQVLVVDDDAMVRRALAAMLRVKRIPFTESSSGEDALVLLETTSVQVVISDLDMPGMHGVELAKALRVKYPDLRLYGFTGNSGDRLRDEAHHVFDRLFSKNGGGYALVEDVVRFLDRKTEFLSSNLAAV